MKPANDPTIDYKALVRRGYDTCASAYDGARREDPHDELSLLTQRLADGAEILDAGCGAGVPIARALARHFRVTGVDMSSEMICRARENVPQATFIQADLMDVEFSPSSFDAVTSFYAIFHLPREEHPELLRRIHTWLKPGGYLLATFARHNEAAYTEDDFFGVTMYWSNFSVEEYQQILADIGFTLLESQMIGDGYKHPREETHPILFAQKASQE